MKKKDCEFKIVIADVYGVADDYIIYAYANTMEEAIEEVKEKLSMAERLVAIEEVREFKMPKMKKPYNVSIELVGDPEEFPVRYYSYIVMAHVPNNAIRRALEEVYKDESNYGREVLEIHLNKLDTLEV